MLDLSTPASPTLACVLPITIAKPLWFTISGGNGYVVDQYEIAVLDLSDPASPTCGKAISASSLQIQSFVNIAAYNDHVYALCADHSVAVLALAAQFELGLATVLCEKAYGFDRPCGIVIVDGYAYVANLGNKISIFNVDKKIAPTAR
ncbi:MAG: hypothetical protein AAF441_14165 [Pseudomonadota bacterium]